MSPAAAILAAFRSRVVGAASWIDQMQAAPDHASFVESLLELGALHGYNFSGAEVEAR